MGSPSENNSNGIISGINVTPLVDIVLVLLIIFMLTASIIANPSIKVDLPTAASGDQTEVSLLGISLTADGQLFLNEEAISELDLYKHMVAAAADDTQAQALIAADKEVLYGSVVRIIDIVKRAGVTRFALNIEADESLNLPMENQ